MAKRKSRPNQGRRAADVASTKEDAQPLRLEWRSPSELAENPRNWRRHPDAQLAALADVIGEVGWAGACLFNERTGRLIDGHARQKVAMANGAEKVPVLVGDWSEADEAKILATLDPLAAMAEADQSALAALLADVDTQSEAVNAMLAGLTAEVDVGSEETAGDESARIVEKFQVLVECETEQQQAEVLERLEREGLTCRSLIS